MEKVVLFFLTKQGDLADRLLGARRDQAGWKTCGSPGQRDGAGKEGKTESWSSDYYCGSPEGTVQAVYCSIGREIAELMRFLQLNGKSFSSSFEHSACDWKLLAFLFLYELHLFSFQNFRDLTFV